MTVKLKNRSIILFFYLFCLWKRGFYDSSRQIVPPLLNQFTQLGNIILSRNFPIHKQIPSYHTLLKQLIQNKRSSICHQIFVFSFNARISSFLAGRYTSSWYIVMLVLRRQKSGYSTVARFCLPFAIVYIKRGNDIKKIQFHDLM